MLDWQTYLKNIQALEALCTRVQDDHSRHGEAGRLLMAALGPDRSPLKVPTNLGLWMDGLAGEAARCAEVVMKEAAAPLGAFRSSVLDLQQKLSTISGELARLTPGGTVRSVSPPS